MTEKTALFDSLCADVLSLGACKAAVVPTENVTTDRYFRTLCEKNVCGAYGRNYMCPPDTGDIDELMAVLHGFGFMLVYQTVGRLEDSFDIEGMAEAAKAHHLLMSAVRKKIGEKGLARVLFLGAGGCRLCEKCAKLTNEPCRRPDEATPSLEAYGVNVSELAKAAGMNYINGQNTVTYFGAVAFDAE